MPKIRCKCGIVFALEEGQTHCSYCGTKLTNINKKKLEKKTKTKITFSLLSKISFISWVVFVLIFVFLGSSESQSIKALSGFILPVIFLGSLSFILGFVCLSLSGDKNQKIQKKENKKLIKTTGDKSPNKFLAILLALIILFSAFLYVKAENNEKNLEDKNFKSNLKPTPTLKPRAKEYVAPTLTPDPDPIIPCNISINCGGGTRQMKRSECNQLTCCELGKNSWSLYANKTACIQAQNNYNYQPCTVYYSSLGYSQTYPGLTNEECSNLRNRVYNLSVNQGQSNYISSPSPLPTVEPYQYSQEYLDALEKFNKEISEPFEPSQFVAPTSKCYTTWEEYFNAHPNYAPQDIQYMSGSPPCD